MRTDAQYWEDTAWDIYAEFEQAIRAGLPTRARELLDALWLCARIRDNTRSR